MPLRRGVRKRTGRRDQCPLSPWEEGKKETPLTVEGLDGVSSLLRGGVLDDAIPAGAALPASGNVHEGDVSGGREDAAELINGGAPGDVTHVETVRGRVSHDVCFVVGVWNRAREE